MDWFTNDDLLELATHKNEQSCISMYVTTYRSGADTQKNPLQFKNLIGKAEELLVSRGMRRTEAKSMMTSAHLLMSNTPFWLHQGDGLALFASPDLFRLYRLPESFSEFITIGNRFHLKPLLKLLSSDAKFYVLDLDIHGVRLFTGTRFTFSMIRSPKLPPGMEETLGFATMDKSTQFSSKPQMSTNNKTTVFGYGRQTDKRKVNILNYFHRVADGVRNILNEVKEPLVISGVEYLHPIYKEANTYPNILKTGIMSDTSGMTDAELHILAWQLIKEFTAKNRERDSANYKHLVGDHVPTAVNDLKTIVEGAQHGRVATLFVVDGTMHVWGRLNEETSTLELHSTEQPGDEDLLDKAAIDTVLNGGKVYVVDPENAPDATPASAILRY